MKTVELILELLVEIAAAFGEDIDEVRAELKTSLEITNRDPEDLETAVSKELPEG